VTGDFGWLAGGYAVRSLAYLASAALLARALGPAGFGRLSLFMALAAAVGYLAGAWPFLALPSAAAQGRALGPVFRGAVVLAAAAAAACTIVVLPLAVVMLDAGPLDVLLLALYAAGLLGLQAVYGLLWARGRMPAMAATQAGERLLTLILIGLVAAVAGLTVTGAELALALAAVMLAVAGLALVRERAPREAPGTLDRRALLRLVGPMAVVTSASYAVAWIDVVILGALASDADVGRYALAYQAFTFVSQLAALSIVAALPRHARRAAAGAGSSAELVPADRLLGLSAAWAAVAALFAVGGAVALEPLFGAGYGDGTGPLALLLAGLALTAPYYALVPAVVALERTSPLAVISVVSVIVNLVLGVALVPVVGIWGPAVATAAQALVATGALAIRELGTRDAARLTAVALPGALAAVAVASAPDRAPVLIAASAAALGVLAVSAPRLARAGAAPST